MSLKTFSALPLHASISSSHIWPGFASFRIASVENVIFPAFSPVLSAVDMLWRQDHTRILGRIVQTCQLRTDDYDAIYQGS